MSRSRCLLVAGLLLYAAPAGAFCIANQATMRVDFTVAVDSEGRTAPFKRSLNPQAEVCCDWQKRRCNAAADPEAILLFSAMRKLGVVEWTCYHSARADARVTLRRHAASQGCSWSSAPSDVTGDERSLWDRLMQAVGDLF